MDWNFFKARKRTDLRSFVGDLKSEEEVLALFAKREISNPPLEEIKQLFAKPVTLEKNESQKIVTEDFEQPTVLTKKTKVSSGFKGN